MDEKSMNQRAHASMRALERYKLVFDDALRESAIALILCKKALLVSRRKKRILYIVEIGALGEEYPVVYDRSTNEICSFLPWNGVNARIRQSKNSQELWSHQH